MDLTALLETSMWPFGERKSQRESDEPTSESSEEQHPSPREADSPASQVTGLKVLLVDMPSEAGDVFCAHGLRATTGSLGHPYKVDQADRRQPVYVERTLSDGWNESEIVVVDLAHQKPSNQPGGRKITSDGELDWWAKCSKGVIDPRPRLALAMQKQCDRICRHGGAFIVFMDAEYIQDYAHAKVDTYQRLSKVADIRAHPWSFLTFLHEELNVESDRGLEMRVSEDNQALDSLFTKHLPGARYRCTLRLASASAREASAELILNKFGNCVGLATRGENSDGAIILLPQVQDKVSLALDIVRTLLPVLTPELFPDATRSPWLKTAPYEHPPILRIRKEIEEKRRALETELAALETNIEQIRSERQFLHDLLVKSGDELKQAVTRALRYLGCPSVVDADSEESSDASQLAEDLRLDDAAPMLLIEVKGILGLPKDEDALAVAKYLAPTMKRLGKTDIQGVTIINHERGRPPDERAPEPFRGLVVQTAGAQGVALLTAWDLFLLCRGVDEHQWNWTDIRPLLEQPGRVRAIPCHYLDLGQVEHVWPDIAVVGARLTSGTLRVGDRVAVEFELGFVETAVESMQIDGEPVEVASDGAGVGLVLSEWNDVRVGAAVYVIDRNIHGPVAGS